MKKMAQENDMFTYAEATKLLETWGIESVEERIKNDRKQLVDEIALLIHENVSFQSITLLATAAEERRLPSFDEIKASCISGVDGLCHELAPFTSCLLEALGFSVRTISSTITSSVTTSNNHVLSLIDGLESDGDIHLVDCGTGFPTFRAISLNFAEESPVFRDSFLEYKYVRHDGEILRMHGRGDRMKRNNPPVEGLDFFLGRWRRFDSIVADQKFDGMAKPVEDVYRAVADGLTPFTSSPRAVRFPRKRAIVIVNNKLMEENDVGELVTTHLKSDAEIMEAYGVHFPQLKQEDVVRALAEWRRMSK